MSGTPRSVLVLTAAVGVPDAVARSVGAALRAEPRRLAASAVEVALDGPLPDGFAVPGVDANLVPVERRRKRLLVADMDSTIIGVECIDEVADFAGVKPQVAAITEAAMRGELDFEGALLARVALLNGLPLDALQRCYDERVRLNPGARTLVRTMAWLGAETVLVSGGFTFFAEHVAAEAGFGRCRANVLLAAEGKLTGDVARPILGRLAKLETLGQVAGELGLGAADVLAVGDGANDLDMVQAAGLGVAYRAKPALAAVADARLEVSDLTALLALQGIPESAWRR